MHYSWILQHCRIFHFKHYKRDNNYDCVWMWTTILSATTSSIAVSRLQWLCKNREHRASIVLTKTTDSTFCCRWFRFGQHTVITGNIYKTMQQKVTLNHPKCQHSDCNTINIHNTHTHTLTVGWCLMALSAHHCNTEMQTRTSKTWSPQTCPL